MAVLLTLPRLPLGGDHATVLAWLAQPGDRLVAGQPLALVLSAHAEVVIPALSGGLLETCLVQVGGEVAVGAALARLADAARSPRLSPVARRIVAAHGIDVAALQGSGPGGRIMKRDLAALLSTAAPRGLPPDHAAPASTSITADLSAVHAWCAQHAESGGQRPPIDLLTCVAAVVAQALVRHPQLNTRGHAAGRNTATHVQLLVGQPGRLVREAQDLNVRGIARALHGPATAPAAEATFALWQADDALPRRDMAHGGRLVLHAAPPALATLVLHYDSQAVAHVLAAAFLYDVGIALAHFTAG